MLRSKSSSSRVLLACFRNPVNAKTKVIEKALLRKRKKAVSTVGTTKKIQGARSKSIPNNYFSIQDENYLPCASQNTAYIFMKIEGKHAFCKKIRDILKCGAKFVSRLAHELTCENRPETEEVRIICYVGTGPRAVHDHRPPTRMEWIDTLLRWCIRIEIHSGLDPEDAMRQVYESWPFKLQHNPKHILATMQKAVRNVQLIVGSRETSQLYLELLGPEARDEADTLKHVLMTEECEEWEPAAECKWSRLQS